MVLQRGFRQFCLTAIAALVALLVMAAPASAFERLGQYGVGLPNSGDGSISVASGVAVAPDGTVVLADVGYVRISVYAPNGKFLRSFGKDVSIGGGSGPEICVTDCQGGDTGTAAGEFGSIWGVAVSASEIYVADLGLHRISVFNFDGVFLRAIGIDVGGPGNNVCTDSCGPGSAGTAAGFLNAPAGLSIDAAGKLYVTSLSNRRVDIVDPATNQYLGAFGKDVGGPGVNTCTTNCGPGSDEDALGSLLAPYSVSVAPSGEIFASDIATSRISVFGPDGNFRRSFGSGGSGAGEYGAIYGAVATGAGVYVADIGNSRLGVASESGQSLGAYGWDVIPGDPIGAEYCTTACQPGSGSGGIGSFPQIFSVATDCRAAVYVGMLGRVEKWGEPEVRTPPCPSNAFTIGKAKRNMKKGTVTVPVTVSGPGLLTVTTGKKLKATAPQPVAAGTVMVSVKAVGKGIKSLAKKGKLKGRLNIGFTPPNGDLNTQSTAVQLKKKLKKKKSTKAKGKGGKPKTRGNR